MNGLLLPNASAEWQTVEESVPGSQLIWRPQNLHPDKDKSEFRVAAVNSIGVGAYGSSKDMPEIEGNGDGSNMGLVVAAAVLILLLVAALCVGAFIWHWRRNKKRMSKAQAVFTLTPIRPGIGGGNHNSPAHMPAELVEELKSLPHVPKSCVNLVRILGKGSFGEVFEGLACNLPRIGPKSLRVAVKTLKTGYSEDDRVKFLKEAILMNNFNHPNIVKLLGVCFDTEPHYLVLELMEGGDLLTFLRSSRPNDTMPSQLSLKDLVGMMVDVGRGGAYMEQRKHVHRDLAARNCLISTRDPQLRVTKIADFGLARDVYSNDYYRVNGQDFLPLRWMSPESTQDGVFSSKTDVWSFGILLWEIMTLGQLPYPGMHNMQVMSFVRNGGHPENPTHCPTEIFEIIEQTWITDVEKRPSFAALLVQLEALKLRPEFIDDSPFPPSPADHGSHTNSAFEHSESAGSNSDSVRISEPAAGGSARFERHGKDDNNRASKKQGRPSILRSLRKQKPKPVAPPSNAELRERLGSVGSSKHSSEKTGSASRPESAFSSGGESFTTLCDDYEVPLTKGMTNLARTERIGVRESPSSTPPTKRPIQLDQVVVTTPPPSTRANQRPSSVPEWGGDNPAYSPTDSQDYYEVPGRKAGSPPSTSADKSSKVQLAAGPNRQHADTSSESNIPPKELPMIRRPKGRAPPPPISQESGGGDEGSEDSTYAEISSPEPTDSNRDSQSTLIKPSPDSLGVDNAAFGERRSSRVSQV
uniref:receptor protein-tyrosine kinase n=1 Tax=Plectus sambesii TaxID=2011161 RepID=A0A914WX94_9BILA